VTSPWRCLAFRASQPRNSTAKPLAPTRTFRRPSPSQKRHAASSAMNGRFSGHCFRKRLRVPNHGAWGMTVRGGCLCGFVEFEVDLPFIKFVKCHCSRCRRATGSAFAANAYVLPQAFRRLSGQDHVVRFDFPLARSFSTAFCRECGSPLPHATRSGREVIIPAGSLLNDPGASPTIDSCWQSRARWLSDAINLPTSD
jgi:hypothetical protein